MEEAERKKKQKLKLLTRKKCKYDFCAEQKRRINI